MESPGIHALILVILLSGSTAAHSSGAGQGPPPVYTEAPPTEEKIDLSTAEEFCPKNSTWSDWRPAQEVLGVEIQQDRNCRPDNPKVVAAATRGTNNVPTRTLMETGLAEDAVEKGRDLDGDGDPDVINITLEVSEINGKKPSGSRTNTVRQEIAPGIAPGFWVFSPKTRGMASEGSTPSELIRVPSPTLRVEQGDQVSVELENTHYMPHTIHFHGVDHGFTSDGEGNDGVPQTSEEPVMPGESRTYEIEPRQPGTMAYHCHVQPQSHVLMGLNGMFVISPEAENNTLQTFNIGGGKVRNPSKPVEKRYDQEYDYIYQDVDRKLHEIVEMSNDPRVVSKMINRGYDVTERTADYFLLNGKSFPYTERESQIIVEKNQEVKLRAINTGKQDIDLHMHGHKPTATHRDGVRSRQIQRDVFKLGAFQRLDLVINTTDNGLDSYGPGVWLMHNHRENAVTTDGIAPGGDLSTITYSSYLKPNGEPEMKGVSWKPYFTEAYYEREVPVWNSYDSTGLFGDIAMLPPSGSMIAATAVAGLMIGLGAGYTARKRWVTGDA
ncbi:MAG: multicopper oxidase domain-containing protein [Candidatus Nanohaloarchaea archaeon]